MRQALGALTPALPKRLPQGDHKYPIWIRYTKKILVEAGDGRGRALALVPPL